MNIRIEVVKAAGRIRIDSPQAKLAQAFAKEMSAELTAEQMKEVRRVNQEISNECATHDFLDANEVMLTAFRKALGRDMRFCDDDPQGEDTDLVNAAWDLAKSAGFRENRICFPEIWQEAIDMMESHSQLEPTSAMKEAAHSAGIGWDEPMADFVGWWRTLRSQGMNRMNKDPAFRIVGPDAKDHQNDPDYLRDLLKEAGLSQRGAARLLGIDERTMRNYCSGKSPVPYVVEYCLEISAICNRSEEREPMGEGEAEEEDHAASEAQRRRER